MKRVQRRRGVALPPNTVYVGRPTRWGNGFRMGEPHPVMTALAMNRRDVISLYGNWLGHQLDLDETFVDELIGKDLACWCGEPEVDDGRDWCHADLLLAAAARRERMVRPGVRPVFGEHRQPEEDAETAPAWPDLGSIESGREARFRRWAKGARP